MNDDVIASNINSVEFNSEFKAVDKDVEGTLDDNEIVSKTKDDGKEQDWSSPQVIGRQVIRCDGVYVKGQVQGFDIDFTVDMGATRTVLSTQTLKRIPQSKKTNLKKSHTMASADGKTLQELGKAIFVIQLGNFNFETELIIADIADETLLGLHILMKTEWGPADLRLS